MARASRRDGNLVAVRELQYFGHRFRRAGQGDGVGLVRYKPFVPRVFGQPHGPELNFPGQNFLQILKQRHCFPTVYEPRRPAGSL
jgi:hypothetical protein